MQLRKLGAHGPELSVIGLGTWAMGGSGWKFAWGPQDDAASIRAVHAALDAGINWIDTAAIYGHGHAETIVGRALRERRRDDVFVATKCGRVWDGDSRDIGKRLKRASIMAEVDRSLARLGVDVIDLYQIHWPEPDEDIEEGWTAVADLVRAGKVRYAGVCNFSKSQLERAWPIHPVTSLQPPYSLLRREIEADVIPWCEAHGVGIVAYSPMQTGLLSGRMSRARIAALPDDDWRRNHPFFKEPELSRILGIVEGLRAIADREGVSVAELALAWVLRLPAMTAAIVGARRPEQIEETAGAGRLTLSPDVVAQIERLL